MLVKDVARRQGISERYLEHLFISLKTAGLVKSVRGAHGGFTLTMAPDKIKLIDILSVTEGPLELLECITDGNACARSLHCATRDIWLELQSAMCEVLGHTRFSCYFIICFYPMQAALVPWNWPNMAAILIFAIPCWFLIYLMGRLASKWVR